MAESSKMNILYLMEILHRKTDANHVLNATQLMEILEQQYMATCNRKSVYADVQRLQDFGMDIRQTRGTNAGYYVGSRPFELPELKLLVDAVQSSKFITAQKTQELIRKIEELTSESNARQLNRQIFIYNRAKTSNETIYENVDTIHSALHANHQIRFKYCEWTVQKKLKQKKGGEDYVVSPWILTWDDENYYLVAFDEIAGQIRFYRVDKMQEIRETDQPRNGQQEFEGFDLAAFSKKTFSMFHGDDVKVTLRCENALAGVILDRFGTDPMLIPNGAGHFKVAVTVSVSPQFFGWVTGLGPGVEIMGPESVRKEYRDYLEGICRQYK
ncbi:MAG: WYL domain-containing protein [Lachnospiraceae bacterium]|nr:WYL domain-containing protein [Lachnospiraceae bacterium]